jgi:hypothetical protein
LSRPPFVGSTHPVIEIAQQDLVEKSDIEMLPDAIAELEGSMTGDDLFMSFFIGI